MKRPGLTGILETALYVADLDASRRFYERLFELTALDRDERFCAYELPGRQVLLLFRRGATAEPVKLPTGVIPSHDGSGRLHVAFSIAAEALPEWEARLAGEGVALESRVRWPRGGTSLYFRDPDGHLVELATPGLWWAP